MCDGNNDGPGANTEPEGPVIDGRTNPQVVVGWNKERDTCECSVCHDKKMIQKGPVFLDAANELEFICSRCAENRVDDGLYALVKLTEVESTQDFRDFLKKYLAAVEPPPQA
jgi:hypothetical protein